MARATTLRGHAPATAPSVLPRQARVCRDSGLRPTRHCRRRITAAVAPDLTLAPCRRCVGQTGRKIVKNVKILSPESGNYKSIGTLKLQLKSTNGGFWFVNGKFVGSGALWYVFSKGKHQVKCVGQHTFAQVGIKVD